MKEADSATGRCYFWEQQIGSSRCDRRSCLSPPDTGLFNTRSILTPTVLNSQMRRIDLFCKLVGPLAIGLLDGFSTKIAIMAILGCNVASVVVEYHAIAKVLPEDIHILPNLIYADIARFTE